MLIVKLTLYGRTPLLTKNAWYLRVFEITNLWAGGNVMKI